MFLKLLIDINSLLWLDAAVNYIDKINTVKIIM